jgi:hypothetical protein
MMDDDLKIPAHNFETVEMKENVSNGKNSTGSYIREHSGST